MRGEPLVQVSGLHRRYGALHAVRGLDLELHRGDVLGLLGANGAGKSTTMAMMAGVLAPSAGRIRITGHDLRAEPLAAKARLGYLPETPPLLAEMTVREFLCHCARLRRVASRAVDAAVTRAVERCGLADVPDRLLGNLSKGYRQRAGIAQAIVHGPEVVILDEPTAGLDPGQLRGVRELIREIGQEHGVIFSTHVLPEVQALCNRVHIIHEGRTALSAAMDALPGDDRRYRVRFARAPRRGALDAIAGVTGATAVDEVTWILTIEGGVDERARVATACAGHGLIEFTPLTRSLEEVFMTVCYSDPAAPGLAGAGPPA